MKRYVGIVELYIKIKCRITILEALSLVITIQYELMKMGGALNENVIAQRRRWAARHGEAAARPPLTNVNGTPTPLVDLASAKNYFTNESVRLILTLIDLMRSLLFRRRRPL